ncbi:uncharacterized protein RBU33_025782 [Hipposideros larvatus]
MFLQKGVRKQKVLSAEFPLKQSAKERDENKEYLRYQNTFLKPKSIFKPSPLCHIQKTLTRNQPSRLPLPIENEDAQFVSQLVCPVVLRRTLCGKEGDTCRCSASNISEVTDLEYDHLVSNQLSSVDHVVIVYVLSAKKKDKTIKEVPKVYRKWNRTRSMPCIQIQQLPLYASDMEISITSLDLSSEPWTHRPKCLLDHCPWRCTFGENYYLPTLFSMLI